AVCGGLHPFPTRRSSDLLVLQVPPVVALFPYCHEQLDVHVVIVGEVDLYTSTCSGSPGLPFRLHQYREFSASVLMHVSPLVVSRSEEHTSELQSPDHLVC